MIEQHIDKIFVFECCGAFSSLRSERPPTTPPPGDNTQRGDLEPFIRMALKWSRDHEHILDTIRTNAVLKVNLSGQKIGAESVAAIAEAMEHNTSVTALILNTCEAHDAGALAIAKMLRENQTLESVIMGNNQIDDEGGRAIVEALEDDNTTIMSFGMEHNRISPMTQKRLATVLERNNGPPNEEDLLEEASRVKWNWKMDKNKIHRELAMDNLLVLKLSNQRVMVEGAFVIAEILSKNASLRYLFLDTNFIGRQGAQAIFASLDANKKSALTFLDLKWNDIDDQGVAHALMENKTLLNLNLAGNQIGDAGAARLVLVPNRTTGSQLEILDMSNNLLTSAACIDGFGPWLACNNTCKRLNLATNKIGDLGAAALADALVLNWSKVYDDSEGATPLKVLDLHYNQIGRKGADALKLALEKAKFLDMVDLRHNKLTEEELVSMFRCVRIQQEMSDMAAMRQGNEKVEGI